MRDIVERVTVLYMWAVQKVSSRFEYLEKRSHGLDVTWQRVRGDLTVDP